MEVQAALRKMRKDRKISQTALAERIGISRYSMWQREKRVKNPSWRHVTTYLAGLGDATFIELAYEMLDVPVERYVIADGTEVTEVEMVETPHGWAFRSGRETLLWGPTVADLLARVPDTMRLYRLIR